MKFETKSEAETIQLGKQLVEEWRNDGSVDKGLLVLIEGDYGVGKTQLVKGIAQGLGVQTAVVSPSYVYIREYDYQLNNNAGKLVHVDAWRLKRAEDLELTGFSDYLKPGNLVVVEWGNMLDLESHKGGSTVVKITIAEERKGQRTISIS